MCDELVRSPEEHLSGKVTAQFATEGALNGDGLKGKLPDAGWNDGLVSSEVGIQLPGGTMQRIGGDAVPMSIQAAAWGGHIALIGIMDRPTTTFSILAAMAKTVRLQG